MEEGLFMWSRSRTQGTRALKLSRPLLGIPWAAQPSRMLGRQSLILKTWFANPSHRRCEFNRTGWQSIRIRLRVHVVQPRFTLRRCSLPNVTVPAMIKIFMFVHCAGLLGLIGGDAGDVFRPSCSTLAAEVQLSARYFTTVGLLLHMPRIQQNTVHTKLSHVGTKSHDPCTGCGRVFARHECFR